MVAEGNQTDVFDESVMQMRPFPRTVVSSVLNEPLDWYDATLVRSDALDVVAALMQESDVQLRSHGSLSLNHSLLIGDLA